MVLILIGMCFLIPIPIVCFKALNKANQNQTLPFNMTEEGFKAFRSSVCVLCILAGVVCIWASSYINSLSGTGGSDSGIVCSVCHKEFQEGSNNARSIARTHMCTSCYRSFKGASDALKEMPLN